MTRKGFLLVLMHPPPAFEEEFNAWYDTEHVPERLAIPGVEGGRRYVCVSGHPRYLTAYDTETPDVLESPAYLRVSLDRSSPWTKRIGSRVRIYRAAGAQVYPGNALARRSSARVTLLRFRSLADDAEERIVAGMRSNFDPRPETLQVRVFAHRHAEGIDYLGMVEARAPSAPPLDLVPFGELADALDLVNTYAPY